MISRYFLYSSYCFITDGCSRKKSKSSQLLYSFRAQCVLDKFRLFEVPAPDQPQELLHGFVAGKQICPSSLRHRS